MRIGVNWGSLDQNLLTEMMDANARRPEPLDARDVTMEAMVESALQSAALAEAVGLAHDRIVLSAKVSGVQDLVDVYRMLAARCDYPLHLGLTEAGLGAKGIIASTAGLSILLQEGIGDTIRVSLTPAPGGDRTEEVRVAQQVLQSLGLRSFTPQVTSCPGCGRTTSTFFQEMAQQIQDYLRDKMPVWRTERPGVEEMKVAVMGCVVNGPGESKHANIGISLPGTFEEPKAPVFVDGRLMVTLKGEAHRAGVPRDPRGLRRLALRGRSRARGGTPPLTGAPGALAGIVRRAVRGCRSHCRRSAAGMAQCYTPRTRLRRPPFVQDSVPMRPCNRRRRRRPLTDRRPASPGPGLSKSGQPSKGPPTAVIVSGPDVGRQAPTFRLPWANRDGVGPADQPYDLSLDRGKTVVLAFYPRDFTSGCTAEMQTFAEQYDSLFGPEVVVRGHQHRFAADPRAGSPPASVCRSAC